MDEKLKPSESLDKIIEEERYESSRNRLKELSRAGLFSLGVFLVVYSGGLLLTAQKLETKSQINKPKSKIEKAYTENEIGRAYKEVRESIDKSWYTTANEKLEFARSLVDESDYDLQILLEKDLAIRTYSSIRKNARHGYFTRSKYGLEIARDLSKKAEIETNYQEIFVYESVQIGIKSASEKGYVNIAMEGRNLAESLKKDISQ